MKFISLLSTLTLAVLPCQAEKRMFNMTFYSVDQNRSIQYAVHDDMGIGIIRTRVARKIVQRLPLTILQYHNESLYDIKTVKDYGLNEHSDMVVVLKMTSKKVQKFLDKQEEERKKAKKAQQAKENAIKKGQEQAAQAQKALDEKRKKEKLQEKMLEASEKEVAKEADELLRNEEERRKKVAEKKKKAQEKEQKTKEKPEKKAQEEKEKAEKKAQEQMKKLSYSGNLSQYQNATKPNQ